MFVILGSVATPESGFWTSQNDEVKSMKKPCVLVFAGYGLNCEEETAFAFETAGAQADIVHINDVIAGLNKLSDYQILAFPGGFAYGDDTGSGNAYAQKIKNHIWKEIEKFLHGNGLVIGICNGCQVLVNLGLIPAIRGRYGEREVALLHNDSARYTVRWVDLKIENDSPWLTGIDTLSVPIAHGEGKLYASEKTLHTLKRNKLIALRYVKGDMCTHQNLPANPTGTLDDIAGITDKTGRIFGIMPHPERAMFFTQLPNWPILAEKLRRAGKPLPKYGPGLEIFKNAVRYFK